MSGVIGVLIREFALSLFFFASRLTLFWIKFQNINKALSANKKSPSNSAVVIQIQLSVM